MSEVIEHPRAAELARKMKLETERAAQEAREKIEHAQQRAQAYSSPAVPDAERAWRKRLRNAERRLDGIIWEAADFAANEAANAAVPDRFCPDDDYTSANHDFRKARSAAYRKIYLEIHARLLAAGFFSRRRRVRKNRAVLLRITWSDSRVEIGIYRPRTAEKVQPWTREDAHA